MRGTTMAKASSSATMAKPSSSSILLSPAIQIKNMSEQDLRGTIQLLNGMSGSCQIPGDCTTEDLYRSHLRQLRLERGRITSLLSVKPAISNVFGTLHGGFVALAAEFLSVACARTVVGEEKEVFLGELSISYLSGAPQNAEVVIEASVLRSGRNLNRVAIQFRLQKTGKLLYTARATLYNMPVAKL